MNVNWEDDIPNIWENKIHGNQSPPTSNSSRIGLPWSTPWISWQNAGSTHGNFGDFTTDFAGKQLSSVTAQPLLVDDYRGLYYPLSIGDDNNPIGESL